VNRKLSRLLLSIWLAVPTLSLAQQGQKNGGLLWKITGNGLEKSSYLFGTMHVVCPEDLNLPQPLLEALSQTNRTYLEIDLDNTSELMSLVTKLMMKNNIRLQDLLTPGQYDSVKAFFQRSGSQIPFGVIERYKPFLLSGMLAQEILACGATEGMDMEIMKETKKAQREVFGLESAADQAAIFDSIPYPVQARGLVRFIDSLDVYRTSLNQMLEAYRRGDLEKLVTFMNDSEPEMVEYSDVMLFRRNKNWVLQMPDIMKEAPTFFAVGAGHLPGEFGVLNLLKAEGFTLEPVLTGLIQ